MNNVNLTAELTLIPLNHIVKRQSLEEMVLQSSTRRSDSSLVGSLSQRSKKREKFVVTTVVMDKSKSPNPAMFGRRVSRSRSVGCRSKSFSGDFSERISTGFEDYTLGQVES
ncbi:hypothetical protein ACSBR2_009300 [Camellia fascicularis]